MTAFLTNLYANLTAALYAYGRAPVRARGAGAIEYVLIAAVIAGLIFAVFNTGLKDVIDKAFAKVTSGMNDL